MKTLPDDAAELITIAMHDMMITRRDKRYVIDMDIWHRPSSRGCQVCLAGCVMSQTLKADIDKGLTPASLMGISSDYENTRYKLLFLNELRKGSITDQPYAVTYDPTDWMRYKTFLRSCIKHFNQHPLKISEWVKNGFSTT